MKGMEEVQKSARTIYRVLLVVCSVLIAVGLDRPASDIPYRALSELKALRDIDWDAYGEDLSRWPGTCSFRSPDGEVSSQESWIASTLRKDLPGIENFEVYAPRRVFGFESRRFRELVSSGSVGDLHRFLSTNPGAHVLGYSGVDLLTPQVRSQLVGAFAEINWSSLEVRFVLEPENITESRDEKLSWTAKVVVVARLLETAGTGGQAPSVTMAIDVPLQPSEKFVDGSRIQDWLRANQHDPWSELQHDGELMPGVKGVMSRVADKTPSEAWREISLLFDEQGQGRKLVHLLGVSVPVQSLHFIGPVLLASLMLLLTGHLRWIRKHWKADEVYWVVLNPGSSSAVARSLTRATIFLLPIVAVVMLVSRYVHDRGLVDPNWDMGWTQSGNPFFLGGAFSILLLGVLGWRVSGMLEMPADS